MSKSSSLKNFSPSGSHTILVFPHQASWQYSDGNTPNGASIASGVGRNCDARRISGYRSMTAAVQKTTATVHRAVYRTDGHASVNHNQHGRPRQKGKENTI